MKRILTLLCLVLLLAPAGALALTGQNYKTFETYYSANVDFINQNDNRHLLPMFGPHIRLSFHRGYGRRLLVPVAAHQPAC